MTFSEERRRWKLSGLMYVDGMTLCGESEKDMRMMIARFSEVCERRGLTVNTEGSKDRYLRSVWLGRN